MLWSQEIKSFTSRDEQEVAGFAQVRETVFASWAKIPVTENHTKPSQRW